PDYRKTAIKSELVDEMKLALVFLSLLVSGYQAAPHAIVPHVINGSPQIVQHATAIFASLSESNLGYFGGGSIISDRHVITGANVVFGAVSVLIGYGGTTFATLTRVTSPNFFIHSAFNRTTLDNDIAIVVIPMASRIVFSDAVRAISLPSGAPPS
ncbi:Chymotrypsin BII, partial [Pseudolycoriella hygida]